MRKTSLALALCVVCACFATAAMAAGEAKAFSISWSDKTVTEMLSTLGKTFGVNYVLPSGLGQARLSVNLIQTTPDRAVQTIVAKAGLRAEKRGGTWYISRGTNQASTGGAEFAQMGMPGFGGPMGAPGGMMGGPGGMMGARGGFGGANPAVAGDLGAPGGIGGFGAPPGRGQQGGTQLPGQQSGLGLTTTRQLSFVVLPIFYASPSVLGQALGFDAEIWDDGGSGGGGGYGNNGGGGYGNDSGGRGGGRNSSNSDRGGNTNRGNSSSNRGNSNRSY